MNDEHNSQLYKLKEHETMPEDPLAFGEQAARLMQRLTFPDMRDLSARDAAAIIYAPDGASIDMLQQSAVAFAADAVGAAGVDSDANSWGNLFFPGAYGITIGDVSQLQRAAELWDVKDRLYDGRYYHELDIVEQRGVTKLFDELDGVVARYNDSVEENTAVIAAMNGAPDTLSLEEYAAHILIADTNDDGRLSMDEITQMSDVLQAIHGDESPTAPQSLPSVQTAQKQR